MVDWLIRVAFLVIEVEICILLFILIRENLFKRRRGKRRPPESTPRQDTEYDYDTSDGPAAGARRAEYPTYPPAAPLAPDVFQEEGDTVASPDILPDIFSGNDDVPFTEQEEAPHETVEPSIKEMLTCGLQSLGGVHSYSSQAMLVEQKEGEFLVIILESGGIQALPSTEYTNEKRLMDVFSSFFQFTMPARSNARKFQIRCTKPAILVRNWSGFSLESKGLLEVHAD